MNAAKSHRNTPEGHIGSSSFFFNDSTDGDIDVCRDGDGDGNREEPSVILAGDACMTALTTLDLRTLSSAWDREITCAETQADSDSDPGCKADLEEQLVVTFSGGEDCLVSASYLGCCACPPGSLREKRLLRCNSKDPKLLLIHHTGRLQFYAPDNTLCILCLSFSLFNSCTCSNSFTLL